MLLTGLGLVAFIGFASLAIDMGHLYVVRNDLQNVADAAALAGANKLITEQAGVALRDSVAAQQAVMDVAQRQSVLSGLTPVDAGARNDLTLTFGNWNIYAGNPETAWTEIGSTCAADSNANGVRVGIRRGEGVAFGPVTNFLAGIFGSPTSEVAATATAYLGFVATAGTGSVDLPLAIPDAVITAANPANKSWWAKWLSPKDAVAVAAPQITFKDLGSNSFYSNNLGKPLFDTQKAYLVTLTTSDPVPGTVNNNLTRQYSTGGTPVRAMARGTRLYPLSEYQWASNISTIFNNFKKAYNAKKDSTTGKYRASVPVYSTSNPSASMLQRSLKFMAGLISFGPSPAYACFTFYNQTYPGGNVPIYVEGFADVDVINVKYEPVASSASDLPAKCDPCSDRDSVAPGVQAFNGQTYSSTVDCMVHNDDSCRNQNSVTVEIPTGSTVSNPGTTSGGPDNQHINPSASSGKGSFAKAAKLVR
jgi:Flp pilus assembly protein TadG